MGGHLCLLSYAQVTRFETHLHIRRFVFACMGGTTLVLDRTMKDLVGGLALAVICYGMVFMAGVM